MSSNEINGDRVYYNYGGKFPPLSLDTVAASVPKSTDSSHPKLITDTTLRDGAQDPHFALFPAETRLAYYDMSVSYTHLTLPTILLV